MLFEGRVIAVITIAIGAFAALPAAGFEIRSFLGHTDWVKSVAFSPDGAQVLTGSDDDTAKLWDASSGLEVRSFEGHTDFVNSVAFSPDGTQVLTGSDDTTAKLWDAASGSEIRTFQGHTDAVNSVAFSPDGTQILTGSIDTTAKLWDANTGTEIRSFTGHTGVVTSVAFSPDGTQVLTGSDDTTARLWVTGTGAEIRSFAGHTGVVTSVTFSPDGAKVLTGSSDTTARIWDAGTGSEIRSLAGHGSIVLSVAFSPGGARVLTGLADTTARLWDADTGTETRTFAGHTDIVISVAFSPDGTQVLTGSGDDTAKLWASGDVPVTIALFGQLRDAFSGDTITCGVVELTNSAESFRVTAVADENGAYFFEPLPADTYSVRVIAPGFATRLEAPIVFAGGEPIEQDYFLVFGTTGPVIAGQLTDSGTGDPLVGALAELLINGIVVADTLTCADGRYELPLAGTKNDDLLDVELRFSLENYETDTVPLSVNTDTGATVDESLQKSVLGPSALVGSVVTASGGGSKTVPLQGARITLRGPINTSQQADAEGRYSFDTLLEGSYTVSASAAGFERRSIVRTLGGGVSEANFVLEPLDSAPGIPGDINGDDVVNAVDVQLVINAALGVAIEQGFDADINGDGQVNAVDIQLVINAALGIDITV